MMYTHIISFGDNVQTHGGKKSKLKCLKEIGGAGGEGRTPQGTFGTAIKVTT